MNAKQRSLLYLVSVILGVLALATVLTLGIITKGQIQDWLAYLAYAVAVAASVIQTISGLVAKYHVTPD